MMRIRLFIILLLIAAATPVVAYQAGDNGPIPSFDSWLAGVSGPLLGTFLAALLSWVTEFFPGYDDLSKRVKMAIYLGGCLAVSVGAALLRGALEYVEWSFDPLIWHAIWNAFAQFGIGAFVHEFVPARTKE
jgi:hypothetical protein